MSSLGYPDQHFVNAALGWLDLHATAEARAELQRITTVNACHPEVLEVWWRIHAAERHWDEALRIADIFRAQVVDSTNRSFVFEITGAPSKIDSFIELMRPLGLVEVSRTGVAAISRGPEAM